MPAARAEPHAEFMQIWEEGYVSHRVAFENMHLPGVIVVEGGPLRRPDGSLDRERILAYIDATIASIPSFRLRLQRPLLGLTPPAWVPDDDFDLRRHVIFADDEVDFATADLRALGGADDPLFSLRHPLWRMRITALTDGDVAVGHLSHHAAFDGMSGMKTMSAMNQRHPDDALPPPSDPFAGVRPARRRELPLIAYRRWRDAQPSAGAAWRAYWSRPFVRRARRAAARILLPVRYRAGGERARALALPPRHSAYRAVPAAPAGRRARELGGTLGDLQAAAVMKAWDGAERDVALRIPVSFHVAGDSSVRNHVKDFEVAGDADAELGDLVRGVHAQLERRPDPAQWTSAPGHLIGYSTLLPWVTSARYFCGGEVRQIVPFPASLGTDGLAAAGILYNGMLFVGANMHADRDVEAAIDSIRASLAGDDGPEHG